MTLKMCVCMYVYVTSFTEFLEYSALFYPRDGPESAFGADFTVDVCLKIFFLQTNLLRRELTLFLRLKVVLLRKHFSKNVSYVLFVSYLFIRRCTRDMLNFEEVVSR